MFSADRRVPFDHPQRLPAALLADGFEINSAHDALASPVMPPIVHTKVGDLSPVTSRLMGSPDWAAARELVLTRVCIGPTEPVKEYPPFGRRACAGPKAMQGSSHPVMQRDRARFPTFGFSHEQGIRGPVDVLAPGAPIVRDLPATWAAIKPGHLVLAQDSLVDGWYEAIVVGRSGDKVTLRSRDYPGFPNFTVPVTAVALVNPATT